jgi:hypothetical protein
MQRQAFEELAMPTGADEVVAQDGECKMSGHRKSMSQIY